MERIVEGGLCLMLYCGIVGLFKMLIGLLYDCLTDGDWEKFINFFKILEMGIYLGLATTLIGALLH